MIANTVSTTESAPTELTPQRRRRRSAALGLIAVLGLAACTSDPGALRVAEDIVEGEFEQDEITEAERDCMLEVLDPFSQDELEQISADLDNADVDTAAEAEGELAELQADLTACRN